MTATTLPDQTGSSLMLPATLATLLTLALLATQTHVMCDLVCIHGAAQHALYAICHG